MPKQVVPLTDTKIRNARPKETDYELPDGQGLLLRVRKNTSKIWLFNYYKPYTKSRTNLSLGSYPAVSLKDARKLREQFRSLLASGVDPKHYRESEHQKKLDANTDTFKAVALQWLEVKKTQVSADHATDILRSLELHLFKYIGATPVQDLLAPKVISVLKPIDERGSQQKPFLIWLLPLPDSLVLS